MENQKRILYFDWLRILAAILVPMAHVSAQNWDDASITSSQWQFMNIYDILAMSSIPIFFMLSGSLLLNPNKKLSYKKLYKRVFFFLIIYFFWLAFYNFSPFILGKESISTLNLENIIKDFLVGKGAYHLWFLPELTILYVISPIIREIFHSKKICEYYLILYIIFGLLLPGILLLDFPYKIYIESLYQRSSLPMLTGYIGYFVLGHYIVSFLDIKKTKLINFLLFAAFLIGNTIAILIDYYDAIKTNTTSTLVNTPFSFPIFMSGCSIFILFKINEKEISARAQKIVIAISSLTFGIYLIHPFIIQILVNLGMNTMVPHTSIMIPFYTLLVFSISGILVFIIKKIPLLKYLVE